MWWFDEQYCVLNLRLSADCRSLWAAQVFSGTTVAADPPTKVLLSTELHSPQFKLQNRALRGLKMGTDMLMPRLDRIWEMLHAEGAANFFPNGGKRGKFPRGEIIFLWCCFFFPPLAFCEGKTNCASLKKKLFWARAWFSKI